MIGCEAEFTIFPPYQFSEALADVINIYILVKVPSPKYNLPTVFDLDPTPPPTV